MGEFWRQRRFQTLPDFGSGAVSNPQRHGFALCFFCCLRMWAAYSAGCIPTRIKIAPREKRSHVLYMRRILDRSIQAPNEPRNILVHTEDPGPNPAVSQVQLPAQTLLTLVGEALLPLPMPDHPAQAKTPLVAEPRLRGNAFEARLFDGFKPEDLSQIYIGRAFVF